LFKFYVEDGLLQSKTIGTFTQYPLMLAWAITIHKSQGKTFDRVIIDVGRGAFSSGQVYVALSRCTTLDGIVLRKLLQKKHIWTDYRVVDFLTRFQYDRAELSCPFETKISLIEKAIRGGTSLRITYLKPNDEKSYRTILPKTVGDMKYQGKTFRGMRAYCLERKADRTFRIDRILAIEETASH
jgi:hypothetical protein